MNIPMRAPTTRSAGWCLLSVIRVRVVPKAMVKKASCRKGTTKVFREMGWILAWNFFTTADETPCIFRN